MTCFGRGEKEKKKKKSRSHPTIFKIKKMGFERSYPQGRETS